MADSGTGFRRGGIGKVDLALAKAGTNQAAMAKIKMWRKMSPGAKGRLKTNGPLDYSGVAGTYLNLRGYYVNGFITSTKGNQWPSEATMARNQF